MTTLAKSLHPVRRDKVHAANSLAFDLPPELEASEPPEARGLPRDGIRLLVSDAATDRFAHTTFSRIGDFLRAGDVVVINTSGTRSAALDAARADGTSLELRVSTRDPSSDRWIVEVRRQTPDGAAQFGDALAGEVLQLPARGTATLIAPADGNPSGTRLWRAALRLPVALDEYLRKYGRPVRYSYVPQPWAASYYQNAYSLDEGSAEMPSAGRGFTDALITQLVARGVQFAPLRLDTGVSSLDDDEAPYAEPYEVPASTARVINGARSAGSRIIAAGTTVIRALETVTDDRGAVHAGAGWTDLVITPGRNVRIDGLLTGFHAPRASHLAMLEAIAGRAHLERAYAEALRRRYLWHEFGDAHLIMRGALA